VFLWWLGIAFHNDYPINQKNPEDYLWSVVFIKTVMSISTEFYEEHNIYYWDLFINIEPAKSNVGIGATAIKADSYDVGYGRFEKGGRRWYENCSLFGC